MYFCFKGTLTTVYKYKYKSTNKTNSNHKVICFSLEAKQGQVRWILLWETTKSQVSRLNWEIEKKTS